MTELERSQTRLNNARATLLEQTAAKKNRETIPTVTAVTLMQDLGRRIGNIDLGSRMGSERLKQHIKQQIQITVDHITRERHG